MNSRMTAAMLLLAGAVAGARVTGDAGRAGASGCPTRVAALGADMSPGGRFEVQKALQVGPHTMQAAETMADEKAQAHGLIPPALLGDVAISSAVLRPLPPGSGLTVTLNPAITLDTALSYANGLLTAGVLDAEIGIAAPTSQRALGTTAFLGLLAAAHAACVPIDPVRSDLAIREVVLTAELAQEVGRDAAPSLMLALKNDASSRHLTPPAALAPLIERDARARHVSVSAARRPELLTFLGDLVASGAYTRIAGAPITVAALSPRRAVVRLSSAPASPRTPAHSFPHTPSLAGIWRGRVTFGGTSRVAARLRGGVRLFGPAQSLAVYRNDESTNLAALRAGDTITVTTDAAGLATRIDATGPVAARVAAPAVTPDRASPVVATLAGFILLALVSVPLAVVAWRRRHLPPTAVVAAPVSRTAAYAPKGLARSPVRRKGPK